MPSAITSTGELGPPALAVLLVRYRYRHLWNAFRHSRQKRPVRLLAAVGVLTPAFYVGLFSQSFGQIVRLSSPATQTAALAAMAGAIALASLMAKAASSESAQAGAAATEFFLARPVSLPALVVARSVAGVASDLFDALFLFPVLVAAAITWDLGASGWAVAAGTSIAVQVGVSAAAQAVQIAVVRLVAPRRRRAVGVALALGSAGTLAGLWAVGTGILRSPESFVHLIEPAAGGIALSPVGLIAWPLGAMRDGGIAAALPALGGVAAAAAIAVAIAFGVARLATRRGWEEAGPSWAEADRRAARGSPLTPMTKDLRLLVRDRSRLAMLIAMPVIFIGVQVFGAAGWDWSTASLPRVAALCYSLAGYMAMLGPLGHMQAERGAFWILRTVPVPIGRLMAGKAKAWAIVLGAVASIFFAIFAAGVPGARLGELAIFALLVAAGTVTMAFLAVAMGCDAADLSDDGAPAIRSSNAFVFFAIAGLYNVVLLGDGEARIRGLCLYLFAAAAFWMVGMERAETCLDPEAGRERRVRAADGAALALFLYLGQRGGALAGHAVTGGDARDAAVAAMASAAATLVLVGLLAAIYLARRPRAQVRMGFLPSIGIATAAGAVGAGVLGAAGRLPVDRAALELGPAAGAAGVIGALALCAAVEEMLFRGIVQRSLEERWRGRRRWEPLAPLASVVVAVAAAGGPSRAVVLGGSVVAASVRYATGRTTAAWVSRTILAGALVLVALRAGGAGTAASARFQSENRPPARVARAAASPAANPPWARRYSTHAHLGEVGLTSAQPRRALRSRASLSSSARISSKGSPSSGVARLATNGATPMRSRGPAAARTFENRTSSSTSAAVSPGNPSIM